MILQYYANGSHDQAQAARPTILLLYHLSEAHANLVSTGRCLGQGRVLVHLQIPLGIRLSADLNKRTSHSRIRGTRGEIF